MIVAVPADTPLTIPVSDPTVAVSILLLLHAPPGTTSVNIKLAPAQTTDAPVIGPGDKLTVIEVVVAQPVGSV